MRLAGALCLTVATLAVGRWAGAADYWSFTYKDFDVLAEGSSAEAVTLARQVGGVDESMRALLRLTGAASEPPTHAYVLPQSDLTSLDAVWSADGGAFFRAGPFDDYLVLRSGAAGANAAVHAARARALLASWGMARLPEWFRHGLSLFMAGARFDHDQLILGQDLGERSAQLAHNWIPMEQFLQLPANDPSLHRSPEVEATYEAQCWWLVHLTLLEGMLDKVMTPYLQRLLIGESQQAAYAATFGIPYDQLDQYLKRMRSKVALKQYTAKLPEAPALAEPQKLNDTQVRAKLAELLLVHEPQSAGGAQMANDVLATDPKNEQALLALAGHEFALRRYLAAQERLQQSAAPEDLSSASHRTLGVLQSGLAKVRDENMPGSSAVDSKAARAAARAHFRRAMEMEPNDPRAPYHLGWMMCAAGDVAGVRELLPKVEAAFYRRPESADLAELLVRMHSIAGNTADVFKYAVAQQRLAATDAERARATARVERLRAQLKAAQ